MAREICSHLTDHSAHSKSFGTERRPDGPHSLATPEGHRREAPRAERPEQETGQGRRSKDLRRKTAHLHGSCNQAFLFFLLEVPDATTKQPSHARPTIRLGNRSPRLFFLDRSASFLKVASRVDRRAGESAGYLARQLTNQNEHRTCRPSPPNPAPSPPVLRNGSAFQSVSEYLAIKDGHLILVEQACVARWKVRRRVGQACAGAHRAVRQK